MTIAGDEPLADIAFEGELIHWRGPSPFHFVAVPAEHIGEIHYAARWASYGWGVVPVEATANGVAFRTSLFPKDGGYLLPVKAIVRRDAAIALGDTVRVRLLISENPARFAP